MSPSAPKNPPWLPTSPSEFGQLKSHWKGDLLSGFLVFLLALPLSLGIARASGFPAAMGVLTAIVGGIVTPIFRVSPLTIKGPAAGLITVCSGAFLEFGGEQFWPMVTAAVLVAAALQWVLALARLGTLSDLFPPSAVHGMLAAIGIIIISKQIPVLLGVEPQLYAGKAPLVLLSEIPAFVRAARPEPALLGVLSMVLLFGYPLIQRGWLKNVPAPMWVLALSIPGALLLNFRAEQPPYILVHIGDFWGAMGLHIDFSLAGQWVFWKYVFMFLFVNSLESLLTVKAIDAMDPLKRTSDYNADLFGLGTGNFIAALLGGLPMISEVVRSSANVGFGARTKAANFFHGLFLLLSMLFLIPVIELIPNASLAALLIFAGYRLASPRQFGRALGIGRAHLLVLLVTIAVTLVEDLLLGVASGIVLKLLLNWAMGAKPGGFFKLNFAFHREGGIQRLEIRSTVQFTHLVALKKVLAQANPAIPLHIDLTPCDFADHCFVSFVLEYCARARSEGRDVQLLGLSEMKPRSRHPEAVHVRVKHRDAG